MRKIWGMFCLAIGFLSQPQAMAQTTEVAKMTLDEAIQIGLVNNYVLRGLGYNISEVNSQINEAVGSLYPKVSFSANYQRSIISSNPFAGSSAGSLFSGLGQIGWLGFNEAARTDDDPNTNPISLGEYYQRQAAGLEAAGISTSSSSNPFAVPNAFNNTLSLNQTLYNAAAVSALKVANAAKSLTEAGIVRQQQQVVSQIRAAFYRVLLAREQVEVLKKSIERVNETVRDVGRTVEQGVAPRFQRLSAEVERGNLDAQRIIAENNAELALSSLKLVLGLQMDQPIDIRGTWKDFVTDEPVPSLQNAIQIAQNNRPDLKQAAQAIHLQELTKQLTQSTAKPIVSAFGSFGYAGRIPNYSGRNVTNTDATDPFKFTKSHRTIFSGNYWDPSLAVGLSLTWNIYDGGTRRAQVERNQIAVDRATLQKMQLEDAMSLEVEQALRSVLSAKQRIASQQLNIERAEENYRIASTRLKEGVGNQLEERQASELLDQTRLGYASAMFDYLNAKNTYETAIGKLPFVSNDLPEHSTDEVLPQGMFWDKVKPLLKRMYGIE
jgi:outer membrane protein TolC